MTVGAGANLVSNTATKVCVYANGDENQKIGEKVITGSTGTEVVTLTRALIQGETICATQTFNGQEGCVLVTGPTVGAQCGLTPTVSIVIPVLTGETTVTVGGVANDPVTFATLVTVYADNVAIGSKTLTAAGTGTEVVNVSALVAGQTIKATQTVNGIESCKPSSGPKVGDCAPIPAVGVSPAATARPG